ncbi:MAG: ABC transporter ATP-binding protein [Spirochaetes bacterium]|nr:ABC transporter ATP-binding protein [Spirochaetota bacterium]MBU1080665.1 ABC transporter ATP-binding protein [Spirochaetota bacterium]
MTDHVVNVRGFTKRYGNAIAVDRMDFSMGRGEIFALLGPNGAGKTSTLECIEGLRRADSGNISVLGLDPVRDSRRLMRRVGVQLQAQGLPGAMTVREALGFFARYRGIAPNYSAAERLGLGGRMGVQASSLSTGQQRRLALALAIQHDPELVILDEPTAGLDVETRDELHAIVAELRAGGTSILLATHDMAEAEKLADRALVVVEGRKAAEGSPRELTSQGEGRTRISISTARGGLLRVEPDFPHSERLPSEEGYCRYRSSKPAATLSALLAWLQDSGDDIVDLRVERPSLEERFLEIVRRKAS